VRRLHRGDDSILRRAREVGGRDDLTRAVSLLAASDQIRDRLFTFYSWCADADIPELTRLATTVQAWWPQIEAFLHTRVTNAATEGTNHLIKDAARVAFGFRNLDNQRRRVRFACTRRHRLATAA